MSREETMEVYDEENTIDLAVLFSDFLNGLKRTWKRTVMFMVIGAVIATLYTMFCYTPKYKASATYAINSYNEYLTNAPKPSEQDMKKAEDRTKTFSYILTSGVMKRKIATEMGVDEVKGVIEAEVTPSTNLLDVAVTDTDPERAYETLNLLVENYPALSEVIVGKVVMDLMKESGVPVKPVNPKSYPKSIVMGILVGLVINAAMVFLSALFRKTIRREEECEQKLHTPCLASIPGVREKSRSKEARYNLNIMDKNIDRKFVESFRIIRNKVDYQARHENIKSFIVTSTLEGEGKSIVAANLALSLAQEGKKVALVDCVLTHPMDRLIFNMPAGKGLIEYLRGELKLSDCMVRGSDILPRKLPFLFIPGGEAVEDATDYLDHPRMKRLLSSLEAKMDYVILDTAPIGIMMDAGILAQYVDGAILVVKEDYARADHILDGMEQLDNSNLKIMGCVLNKAD